MHANIDQLRNEIKRLCAVEEANETDIFHG